MNVYRGLIRHKIIFIGICIGAIIALYLYLHSFQLEELFSHLPIFLKIIFPAILTLCLYFASQFLIKNNYSENRNLLVDIAFLFYRRIRLSVSALTISLTMLIFYRYYGEFIYRYWLLDITLLCLAIAMFIYFLITAASTFIVFRHKEDNPGYHFETAGDTVIVGTSTFDDIGAGKIYSSEIYLLSVMLINIGFIGLLWKLEKLGYALLLWLGIIFYSFWIHNKDESKLEHIRTNSFYAALVSTFAIFVMKCSSIFIIQMYQLTGDIVRSTEIYSSVLKNKIKIDKAIKEIGGNANKIHLSTQSIINDVKLVNADMLTIEKKYKYFHQNIKALMLAVKTIESNNTMSPSKIEELERSLYKSTSSLLELKGSIDVLQRDAKKARSAVLKIVPNMALNINNIEAELATIKDSVHSASTVLHQHTLADECK